MKRLVLVLVLFLLACAVTPFGQSPLGQSPLPTQQKPKGDCYTFPNGMSCGGGVILYDGGPATMAYEPLDVPAVKGKAIKEMPVALCSPAVARNTVWFSDGSFTSYFMGVPAAYQNLRDCTDADRDPPKKNTWTCADKERILETSESGKHWCRKVQN